MPQDQPIDDDVKELIRLVFRFVRNAKSHGAGADEVRGLLGAANFGPRHLPVLFTLAMNGPDSVGEVAGRLGLSPATVSQLVNELERGGFVDRREDTRDRRRTIVSLSERHRRPIEDYTRRRLEPLRVTAEALSPVERAHFIKGWRILVQSMERAAGGAAHDATSTGAPHGPCGGLAAGPDALTGAAIPADPCTAGPSTAGPSASGPGTPLGQGAVGQGAVGQGGFSPGA
ncbi:MAG TPA: MarR family winged helix-turn-helix transcriptional regulator [Streptosporangiaceae bacterium]